MVRVKTNSKGFSLIEALVAMAILGGLAMMIASFTQIASINKPSDYRRVCESITNTVLAAAQERGPFEAAPINVPWGPLATDRDFVRYSDDDVNADGTVDPDKLPRIIRSNYPGYISGGGNAAFYQITSLPAFAGGITPPSTLNSYQQIRGSVQVLSAIYNNVGGVRCNWATYPDIIPNLTTLKLPLTFANIVGANGVQIRMDPFNTTTGNLVACPGRLHIRPPSAFAGDPDNNVLAAMSGDTRTENPNDDITAALPAPPPATAVGNDQIARNTNAGANTVSANTGIQLSARVRFTLNGAVHSCEASQRFQYQTDRTRPIAPNIVTISRNDSVADPTIGFCQPAPTHRVDIQVGYSVAMEAGTQLFCRDLSAARAYTISNQPVGQGPGNTMGNDGTSVPCIMAAGRYDTNPDSFVNLVRAAPGVNPLFNYNFRSSNIAGQREYWRPCDQLRICGRLPNPDPTRTQLELRVGAAVAVPPAQPTNFLQTLSYDLPSGCMVNFETMAVDTAGNMSASAVADERRPANGAWALDVNRVLPAGSTMASVTKPPCGVPPTAVSPTPRYVAHRGTYCTYIPNAADDDNKEEATGHRTKNWRPHATDPNSNTVGGRDWVSEFPNGYYTCRKFFGGTGGVGGSGSDGCCVDALGSTTCTPFN